MEIARVGVLGCGVMGSGIAQLCAMKGYSVVVCEKNETILDKGMAAIQRELARLVRAEKLSEADAERFFTPN